MASSLISGSLIPLFLFVNLAATISLNGPAVSSPINPPIKIAKLKNPILAEEKLYGGAAKACDCVRLRVRNEDADHDTTNAENSTIGKRHSFQGSMNSMNILPSYGCAIFHCAFDGLPRPSQESWCVWMWVPLSALPLEIECSDGACAIFSESIGTVAAIPLPFWADDSIPSVDPSFSVGVEDAGIEPGAKFRLYLVSGNKKAQQRVANPKSAVLSHQKFRQPTALAMGPAIMGPTCFMLDRYWEMGQEWMYHKRPEVNGEV